MTNTYTCRVCGEVAVSFHYGACDECTKLAVEALMKRKQELRELEQAPLRNHPALPLSLTDDMAEWAIDARMAEAYGRD